MIGFMLKIVVLLAGFFILFCPSITDEKGKKSMKVLAVFFAFIILICSVLDAYLSYKKEKRISPDEMNFTITYSCRGINKEEDILKLCPETFTADLINPKRTLEIHFSRVGGISHTYERYSRNSYYVTYKSIGFSYPYPFYNYKKRIESEDDIRGEEIVLECDRFLFQNKLKEYLESENLTNNSVTYKFDCTLDIKGKEYVGELDSTYFNLTHYGILFKIE